MKKGFTLIEIIVVMSLILIIFGLSVVNYSRTTMESTLEREAKKFTDILYQAKDKANNGDTQFCNFAQGAAGSAIQSFSYRVRLINGPPLSYALEISCNGTWRTITTSTVANGLSFGGNGTVVYLSFNQGVSPAQNYTFLLRHTGLTTNDCIPIMVNRLGVIETMPRTSCTGIDTNTSRCVWTGTSCLTMNNCSAGNTPSIDCSSFASNNCTNGIRRQWRTCN